MGECFFFWGGGGVGRGRRGGGGGGIVRRAIMETEDYYHIPWNGRATRNKEIRLSWDGMGGVPLKDERGEGRRNIKSHIQRELCI